MRVPSSWTAAAMAPAAIWVLLAMLIAEANSSFVPGVQPEELDVPFLCGYESCPAVKDGMINVHLVPHTHNDVGWLRTVEQYFVGGANKFDVSMENQKVQLSTPPLTSPALSHRDKLTANTVGVEHILDSVMDALQRDPQRRFVYAETAYFWKWWSLQNATRRHQVRDLVQQGRLEFIGGGWTMNDEAVTHYQSIIDQITWGLRRLNDTFGECGRPRVGWQIDPFGHSREMASILTQMGYDGLFLGRIHYQEKAERLNTKRTEMVWLDDLAELFTHILYNHYTPPHGFCFDVLCNDDPMIDDLTDKNYNVPERVNNFVEHIHLQSQSYNTKHLLITMGGDFTYWDAERWFTNLDKLIKHTNALQEYPNAMNVNLLYSTPSCYLKEVNLANLTWDTKIGDFFPYASEPHVYWTGYYSSRPTLKYFERFGNHFLQVCKQLYALTNLESYHEVGLDSLREAMGIMQHHDAITGTAKQNVVNDYTHILSEAIHKCVNISGSAISKLLQEESNYFVPLWETCLRLNESQCSPSEESQNFVVTVYNPLAQEISPYVRIPVSGHYYHVQDSAGDKILNQIVPIPDSVLRIPGRVSHALYELIFHAENLKPLGFRSYFISEKQLEENSSTVTSEEAKSFGRFGHENHHYRRNRRGFLKYMRTQGVKIRAEMSYHFYETSSLTPHFHSAAGAYIFRPNIATPKIIPQRSNFKTYKGPLVSERHEVFNDWLSQVVRIYNDELYTEVEWLVGPLPIEDSKGKEVVVKYKTNLKSEGIFFTDSNGHNLITRKRNVQPNRHFEQEERIAGNYYPVTNRMLMRDYHRDLEFCVLTDRAQGGSSPQDGQLELMLHRRLVTHDSYGLDEILNEEAFGKGLVVRGKHYLVSGILGTNLTMYEKKLSWEKLMAPMLFFTRANDYTYKTWSEKFKMEFHGTTIPLPQNIHLLTLEPWKKNSILLRFENLMESTMDPEFTQPVTLFLKDTFVQFEIISAREATLGANQWKSDSSRLYWEIKDKMVTSYLNASESSCNYLEETFSITLYPMKICTLIVQVKYTKK